MVRRRLVVPSGSLMIEVVVRSVVKMVMDCFIPTMELELDNFGSFLIIFIS